MVEGLVEAIATLVNAEIAVYRAHQLGDRLILNVQEKIAKAARRELAERLSEFVAKVDGRLG
jgi:hypothetical protein